MGSVHLKYVPDRGHAKLVFMREIQTVKAVDQLRATGDADFFGMTVGSVQSHSTEYGVAQCRKLLDLVSGRKFDAWPVPWSTFIHHQFDGLIVVGLAHA